MVDDTMSRLHARMALLSQLVRMNMLEQAFAAGKTPEDVLAFAENVRSFFETNMPVGAAEMYLNAEVTTFFNALADELKRMRESGGDH